MKYPRLVRERDCTIPVSLRIYQEGLSEDGEPLDYAKIDTKCNFQSGAKRRLTDNQSIIEVYGNLLFSDDIVPSIPEITSGEVIIFGEKREIIKGYKERNPDGSVNYTRIEIK